MAAPSLGPKSFREMGDKSLELLRIGKETPGSSPCLTRPLDCHQGHRMRHLRPGLAGATDWQEGHVQAPRTAFCLLEEPF